MGDIRGAYRGYARQHIQPGVVHLGVGNFHRAHQAYYLHQLLARGETRWGIYGVSILGGDRALQQALTAQDGLYTLVQHNDQQQQIDIMGALLSHRLLEDARQEIIDKIADDSTKLVTLTVTEAGYNFNDVSGEFFYENPDIQYDLHHPQQPKTFYGLLCESLRRRRAQRVQPPTLLSCDNVGENGRVLRRGLLSYASQLDPDLASWIADQVCFPNCMVDRITPRTPPDAAESWQQQLGYCDRAMVFCEPFALWIIENDFSNEFPDVGSCKGVYLVDDVVPFERMKMLLLNASHQAIVHLAALAGYNDFAAFAQLPTSDTFLRQLMQQEARPIVGEVPLISVEDFIDTTIARFKNRKLGDTVARIAAVTSSGYTKFVIPTLMGMLEKEGRLCPLLSLSAAAWFEFLYLGQQQRCPVPVQDPRAPMLTALAGQAESSGDYLSFFTTLCDIFPAELVRHSQWMPTFMRNLRVIRQSGPVAAMEELLAAHYQKVGVGK